MADLSRTALVTGGSGGIGAALCSELVRRGHRVVVADLHEPDTVSPGVSFVETDVTRADSLAASVAHAVALTGRLDHVFLNAGITTETVSFDDRLDLAAYRRAVAVNLDGVVLGIDAALPALRRSDDPAIVVTGSLAGMMPIPSDPIYSATKHAVVGLVRSLGPAIAPVRINAVCPTFTDTPILDGIREHLQAASTGLLEPGTVAQALADTAIGNHTGQCFYLQVGRPYEAFEFRRPPGPRADSAEH